jgi:hypothetical protein
LGQRPEWKKIAKSAQLPTGGPKPSPAIAKPQVSASSD